MHATETKRETELAAEMALVHAAKEGDLAAFEQLVRLHQARVFRIALNIIGSREDAEEVAQEVFLKAYLNLGRFEERSRFSTWLTRIAVNTTLMWLRHRRGYEVAQLCEDEAEESSLCPRQVVDWRLNPEQLYGRSELREMLARTLNTLSPHQRSPTLLRNSKVHRRSR